MDRTLLIVGGAAAALYFLTRRPAAAAAPMVNPAAKPGMTMVLGANLAGFQPAIVQTAASPSPKSIGSQVDDKARTYAGVAGEKAAQELCGWLGAGGLSDQCGAVGSKVGEYAYEGAKKGVKAVGNAIEDAWNSIF